MPSSPNRSKTAAGQVSSIVGAAEATGTEVASNAGWQYKVSFVLLIIIGLIPLALRGVSYKPMSAAALLKRNKVLYGLGGIVAPFVGIKLIDMAITAAHLV